MTVFETSDIKRLKGIGYERLVDIFGNRLAEFFDGNMITACPAGNVEITKKAA
jgi:hypothetical protein